mmetsp:Transcript_15806/g.39283  ORF Transcript_15806/g.39283 Transcript_15806/m.39283 type:complete len:490 (+) Transcript_15806:208-1677(+)
MWFLGKKEDGVGGSGSSSSRRISGISGSGSVVLSLPTVFILAVASLRSYWSIETNLRPMMMMSYHSTSSNSRMTTTANFSSSASVIIEDEDDTNTNMDTVLQLEEVDDGDNSNSDVELPCPDSSNVVLALIAMGDAATHTFLTERCVSSIRSRGQWDGHIMILTDSNDAIEKFNHTLVARDDKIILRQASPEDLEPRDADGTLFVYKTQAMIFKRFKTKLVEYLQSEQAGHNNKNSDSSSNIANTVEYLFYLDIDNVVTRPVHDLLRSINEDVLKSDYPEELKHPKLMIQTNIDDSRHINNTPTTSTLSSSSSVGKPFSFISAWRESHHYQMGQIFFHKDHGKGCLDAWQGLIDTSPTYKMEQPLMMKVLEDPERYNCRMLELPKRNEFDTYSHFKMLSNRFMPHIKDVQNITLPSIVHISGLRVRSYTVEEHLGFLLYVLDLGEVTTKNATKVLDDMVYSESSAWGNITWRQILEPGSPRGHKPKVGR